MAQQHLEQVLTAAGVPADTVKTIAGLAADAADFKPDEHVGVIRTGVETALKNDPKFYEGINKESIPADFLKKIEGEQYGRAANIVRTTMLKAAGMTEKDFEDLGDNAKKIEVFTPEFAKRLNKGDVTAKELQTKLMEANQQIEQLTAQGPELEKKYKSQYETDIAAFQLSGSALAHLAQAKGLNSPPAMVVGQIVANLKGKYAFAMVNGVPEPRDLKNPELKAMNAAKTAPLTFTEVMDEEMKVTGLIDPKKIEKTKGSDTIVVDPEKGGLKMHKGVSSKVQNRLEQDKKNAGAQ
jgi:hypothetical protein